MAKKISQLTQATEVKSDDVTVIVQDGETKKLPLNMMVTKQDIENKKVAGLAKLDEIEATYENDTYTPTITVKNKSSVKTGEGDEVDYSANVMDGHAKSAILKGNTLVNLVPNKGENTIVGTGDRLITYELPYILSKNKKYLLCCNIKTITTPSNTGQIVFSLYSDDGNTTQLLSSSTSTGYLKTIFTTLDQDYSTQKLWVYIRINETTSATFDNIMLLEYQEGMENWDIPYFEGMQSVKLPVLTTTGKNLFDKDKPTSKYYIDGTGKFVIGGSGNFINQTHFIDTKRHVSVSFSERINMAYVRLAEFDKNNKFIKRTLVGANGNLSFELSADTHYIVTSVDYNTNYFIDLQIEFSSVATTYEPHKSNILTVNEDVTLRGIGKGSSRVEDELDCLTGKVTERVSEIVFDGSENWIQDAKNDTYTSFLLRGTGSKIKCFCVCDKLPQKNEPIYNLNSEGVVTGGSVGDLLIFIKKERLNTDSLSGFKEWLSQNPITVQYPLATESVKTVDLMPSGTHPSTTPYCWKNGHIQLSSSGLLPNLEYSVVTSRAGQINQNATMIVKNDKRIFDLEILLAGGLVNTTYQALTLQNQVETGLSKVSLNSETEPDYLLYHMIMKLIEEKAYKLDDLTEKVSVFYLYEKLSDEQFETIYSALYPFVEDEIVEEPVVEELPEVVEDEVIM